MSHFCQLIQTMESELFMTRVNRCEVWTNPIRYFSLLSNMFWIHVSWKGWFESLKWFPSLDLCITKGVDLRVSILVLISWSLNLWYYICFLMDFGLHKLRALLRMTIRLVPIEFLVSQLTLVDSTSWRIWVFYFFVPSIY